MSAAVTPLANSFSVDPFLDREQSRTYNCFDFVRETWLALTGEDISAKLTGLVGAFASRRATVSGIRGFQRLLEPESPCFAVMQRFRFVPHIGIYLDGRILHLTNKGAQFQPLVVARQYFISVKYYR